ncbi:hypothetical protein VE02_02301 [Pseudogymnoascus sp. 03VT05]|nr:hypothetical protein VE02_02301 [Pseudogymnoascus sp. 03VT05]
MEPPRTPPPTQRKPSQQKPGQQNNTRGNLFANNGDDLESPVPKQVPSVSHELHTTNAAFEATKKKLEASKVAKIWKPISAQASKFNLVEEQNEPAFVSMDALITSHFAIAGELEPIETKSEPLESLALPDICLQFVRATELWFHHLPKEEIHSCLPVNAGKLGRKDHSFIYYEREVTEYARSVSRRTLDRGFRLSCMLIESGQIHE